METISTILASFDIFQVLLSAFPMLTEPIGQAFDQIVSALSGFFRDFIVSHPGITLGIGALILIYTGFYALGEFRRFITVRIRTSGKRIVE